MALIRNHQVRLHAKQASTNVLIYSVHRTATEINCVVRHAIPSQRLLRNLRRYDIVFGQVEGNFYIAS